MSIPEYSLSVEDHRTVLVLVKNIGDKINLKSFNNIYKKISQVQYLKLSESNSTRYVWIRYEKNYPPENNDWGDFQTYRKVLGLISIGKSNPDVNIEDLCKEHTTILEKYNNTVFDSRCFLFNTETSSPSDTDDATKVSSEEKVISSDNTDSPILENIKSDIFKDSVEPVPKSHIVNENGGGIFSQSPSSHDYDSFSKDSPPDDNLSIDLISITNEKLIFNEPLKTSNESIVEVVPNINVDSSIENVSSDSNGSVFCDREALNFPQLSSKSKKIIMPSISCSKSTHCVIYSDINNCEQIEQDVKEFINSIFWILESKRLDRSFEKQDKIPLLTAPFERKNFVGIDTDTKLYKKRCMGRMKKHTGDLALQAGLPSEAFSLYSSSIENLKSSQDWLWLAAAYEGQCASSVILMHSFDFKTPNFHRNPSVPLDLRLTKIKRTTIQQSRSLPLGTDAAEYKAFGKNILSFEEIMEKYEEALAQYEKYHGAAIVEIECSMKAAKVLALHEKYLHASAVLQNVIFTSLVQTDEEKLHRFNAVAQIYSDIGFHRKASFFKRIAAMRCVSVSNSNKNWTRCYHLLLESLEGFCLPLDTKEFPADTGYGWPGIQLQMLLDLVGVSKQMNNQAVAVRHMTFLLHTLLQHLTPSDQQEVCNQLELLTTKCEGAPVPLAIENGLIIPPVNLLNLPRVKSLKLQNLAPHLRPVKILTKELQAEYSNDSIFIFSPYTREKLSKDSCKMDFKWVAGDVCEVSLQVFNPLPFELKVTHMGLLADNIPFESFPACLSLPPESGPYPVNLLGTPLNSGELQILGYTTHVLGVKSNCRLIDIPAIKKPFQSIEVIPQLPKIHVSTSLPKASTFSSIGDTSYVVISASATMFSGECRECTITITNTSTIPVEKIEISLLSKLKKDMESSFFTWSKENFDLQLPVSGGNSAILKLNINAMGDFVKLPKPQQELDISQDGSKSPRSSSTGNTPVRRKAQVVSNSEAAQSKIVEAVLQIQYSGGPGLEAGYCRQCALALTIEVLPSMVITKWDVLPSEISTHCYLVLDIQNSTAQEMEVLYSSNKHILIEARDICRIPVSVERCPLSVISSLGDVWESVDICGHRQNCVNDSKDIRKAFLLKACRDHLVKLVDLQWQLSAGEVTGRASISEIKWSDDMVGFILISPILWDIDINGKSFKTESEFSSLVGDLITIRIKLLNVSDVILSGLHLYIQGYQDYQNGNQSFRLETKRAIIGRDKLLIAEIKPHEELAHECSFIFFHSGLYKVNILCSHNDPNKFRTSNMLSDSDVSEIKSCSKSQIPCQNDTCLIQKCSPSIDLVILED